MQSHHEVTKPFRKQDPKDIVKYICNSNMDDTRRKFRNMYNIEINTYIVVGEEPTVNIKENVPVPCALLYLKDRRYYAMGVVDKAGEIDIDCTYQLTVPIVITYTMWGTYQRIPWTYMEILQSINWRIDFMKTPKYLNRPDKVLFEKSRWMMFAFWSEDLDKLIKLELELMDKIMKIDKRKRGIMAKKIPELHGCKTLKMFREYLIKQYKETKFSFNEIEIEFIKKANIGAHIKYVLIETMT